MAAVSAAQKDLGSNDKWCPVCGGPDSGQRSLILRQINAEEAVYVCENSACCYPVGYDVKVVRRPMPELLGKPKDTEGTTNQSGHSRKEIDNTNGNSKSNVLQTLESASSQPLVQVQASSVEMTGMYEETTWNSTAAMIDSLLDPEVVDFFDSMQ